MTHTLSAHFLPLCAPEAPGTFEYDLDALGDFPPTENTHEFLPRPREDVRLVVPPATRAVVIQADSNLARFQGVATREAGADAAIALWPLGADCPLFEGDGDDYPGRGDALSFGATADGGLLLIAGGEGKSRIATGALTVDLGTGEARPVRAVDGPHVRRAGATVTPFGRDLLVAGGYDPVTGARALGSAEVFQTAEGSRRFDPEVLDLDQPRAHHAAVVLDTGETLLVGGVDEAGAPLGTLEAFSPDTRRFRISGLADLTTPRVDPLALRLSDGRIAVAGGRDATSDDATPIETVEFFTPGASEEERVVDLAEPGVTTYDRAFVAMPGGGVLVAGGCAVSEASSCAAPCRTTGCPSRSVLFIDRDGAVTRAPDGTLAEDAPAPVLIAGEEGRPFLYTGSDTGAFLRFEPWLPRFVAADGPAAPAPVDASPPPRFLAIDPGLFLWIATDPTRKAPVVSGHRHSLRGPFTQAVAPLLLTGTDGIALDRLPGNDARRDPTSGDVVLDADTASLVLTDTSYLDFTLELEITIGAAPVVHLGDTALGSARCEWPGPSSASASREARELTVTRTGSRVRLSAAGHSIDCRGPSGRVAVRLEASNGPVTLHSIAIMRDAD